MSAVSAESDPYEILQVNRSAEPEVIRAAYRALAAKWHPDRGPSPDRMISINGAWQILGDPRRRAEHDASSAMPAVPGPVPSHREPGGTGIPIRRPHDEPPSDSLIDFGRYAGWRVSALVEHDPDYAVWLARTPIGRRLSAEIDAALVRREAQAAALAPPPPQPRRSFLRRRLVEAR